MDDPYENNYGNAEAFEFDHGQLHHETRFNPTNNYKKEVDVLHAHIQTAQPNPGGANVYALATYGTPPFNIIGNAYFVRRMPYPCEPALQATINGDVNTQLGGLIAGQNISQPLYDEATDTYGGYNLA